MSYSTKTSSLDRRKYISRGCSQKNILEFIKMQKDYYNDMVSLVGESRFTKRLEYMFQRFVTKNNEIVLGTGNIIDVLPSCGNFDTGDASADTLPEFAASIKKYVRETEEYRKYYGAEAKDEMKVAVRKFLRDQGLIPAELMSNFDVILGCGTVNIYDAICKKLIKRHNDAIILPVPSYGFFIPQIFRAKGEAIFLNVDANGKVSFADVCLSIKNYNDEQHCIWKALIDKFFCIYFSSLASKLGSKYMFNAKQFAVIRKKIACSKDVFETDRIVSRFIKVDILHNDKELIRRVFENSDLLPPSPARVVGFLHINPNIYGAAYTQSDIDLLSDIFKKNNIMVIEDLAYFPIKSQKINDLASFLPKNCDVISLLGVSKPFALANFRIGVAVTKPIFADDCMRRIESSVGFIPMSIQKAVIDMYSVEASCLDRYFEQNNFSTYNSYAFKKKIMLFGLEGINSTKLSNEDQAVCESFYKKEIKKFFRKKRQYGIELYDEDYLIKNNVDIYKLSRKDQIIKYEQLLIDDFFKKGVSAWFTLVFNPEWGFFSIIDCEKLISYSPIAEIDINNSFDVFALLAFFFGFRTIPVEAMGIENPKSGQHVLRFTFSVKVEVIIVGLFTIFVGINQLINMQNNKIIK